MKPNYVSLWYNSNYGYQLIIDSETSHTRAIFCDMNDAKEYMEFKAGKVIARMFEINFKEIVQVIVENKTEKTINLPYFVWKTGDKFTGVN